jgi:cell division protease FtsH
MGCNTKNIILILIIVFLGITIYSFSSPKKDEVKQVPINQLVSEVKNNEVKKINVDGQTLNIVLKDGQKQTTTKEESASLTELFKDQGVDLAGIDIEVKNSSSNQLWYTFLSGILPVILIGLILFFMFKSAAAGNSKAMSFGQSGAKLAGFGPKKITFTDVAGLKEAKEELVEVVDFLKNPAKFKKLGAEIPKGVLLVGPPGTGKTLLAKAVAGEAKVPFFSISASEFVEMFVGVGASRVRDLFVKAKKNSPAIIFIDEMDAVGRLRGAGLGGSHDEREQTLNQILVEMDGFGTDTNVIVLASTNRPDVLDPALLRPGRFDRRVVLDLPSYKDRQEILKVHTRNKPLAKDVDLEKIAKATVGFSGADLKNLANEAAIFAARNGQKTVNQHNLEISIEKVVLGPERKSLILDKKEKEMVAYHESGHAIVSRFVPNSDPVHKVSIVARGMALGVTMYRPEDDKHLVGMTKIEGDIAMMLGGRAAEKLIFNELSSGSENDIKQATDQSRRMVKRYGMSEKLGPASYGDSEEATFLGKDLAEHKNYSEKTAALIDEEIKAIVFKAEGRALQILKSKNILLKKVAQTLLEKETLSGEELDKILGIKPAKPKHKI